jgi:hypothetical protein
VEITKTVFKKALEGDIFSIFDLLTPIHGGVRVQVEIAIPILEIVGASGTLGGNLVYNRVTDQLAGNIDWAGEPGVGISGGVSIVGGPILGWCSSNIDDVTSGYSGILSGTAAAQAAVSVAIMAPLEGISIPTISGLHIDPKYGQVLATGFFGAGAGAAYAGAGAGINGQFYENGNLLRRDFSQFLPWH